MRRYRQRRPARRRSYWNPRTYCPTHRSPRTQAKDRTARKIRKRTYQSVSSYSSLEIRGPLAVRPGPYPTVFFTSRASQSPSSRGAFARYRTWPSALISRDVLHVGGQLGARLDSSDLRTSTVGMKSTPPYDVSPTGCRRWSSPSAPTSDIAANPKTLQLGGVPRSRRAIATHRRVG